MRYSKNDVLSTLRENRAAHKKAYRAARAAWRESVKDRYSDLLDQFNDGVYKNAANPLNVRPRPKHHLGDYDAAIAQVEAARENSRGTIHLHQSQYDAYLKDQWGWPTTAKPVNADFPYVVGYGW